jgi:hypothetical protein
MNLNKVVRGCSAEPVWRVKRKPGRAQTQDLFDQMTEEAELEDSDGR